MMYTIIYVYYTLKSYKCSLNNKQMPTWTNIAVGQGAGETKLATY